MFPHASEQASSHDSVECEALCAGDACRHTADRSPRRLGQERVRASSRLNSRLFTVFPCSHVAPMCLHQQALTRPVGAWGTNYRLRPVLATELLTALIAGNVAVLFANSVQVISGYNLVVLRVAAEMRAG